MGDQHTFNSYIRNNWVYESQINNVHSFDAYIRNTHSFEITLSGLAAEPSTELFWFLNIDHSYHVIANSVLLELGLQLDVDVPEVSLSIDSELITFLRTIEESVNITIGAPMITSVMELSQLMGEADLGFGFSMGASMSETKSLTESIQFGIQMEAEMSAFRYYMLNDYDSELLSNLDSNLLSAMDSVEV